MNLAISFTPAVGFSGTYYIVAYGSDNASIPLGQTFATGPFGSTVSVTINGVATKPSYNAKIYTVDCANPVGQVTITP